MLKLPYCARYTSLLERITQPQEATTGDKNNQIPGNFSSLESARCRPFWRYMKFADTNSIVYGIQPTKLKQTCPTAPHSGNFME